MDEREEILSYLEQVRAEVVRRRAVVRECETAVSVLEQTLRKISTGVALDVQTLKVGEGRRAQVNREIAIKRKVLEAALMDLQSAERRERDVMQELDEFNAQ